MNSLNSLNKITLKLLDLSEPPRKPHLDNVQKKDNLFLKLFLLPDFKIFNNKKHSIFFPLHFLHRNALIWLNKVIITAKASNLKG